MNSVHLVWIMPLAIGVAFYGSIGLIWVAAWCGELLAEAIKRFRNHWMSSLHLVVFMGLGVYYWNHFLLILAMAGFFLFQIVEGGEIIR